MKKSIFLSSFFINNFVGRSVGPSVRQSVHHIFDFRAVFALLILPNCPRLDCRVSSLVFLSYFFAHFRSSTTVYVWFCCMFRSLFMLMTQNWPIYRFLNDTAPAQPHYSLAHPLAPAHPPATSYWLCIRPWFLKTRVCAEEKNVKCIIFTAYSWHALTAYFWHKIIHNVNAIRWNCYMNMSEAYILRFSKS